MDPAELFKLIQKSDYIKTGLDVDYFLCQDHENKVIRLLFQESRSVKDWIVNFSFPVKLYKRQSKFYLVHSGYKKAWKSCNDEIMNAFINLKQKFPEYKTEICGWSYGGAMSLFAAEDYFYRTFEKVDSVISYGAPKPLFGYFAKKHFGKSAKEFKQYTLSYDFVTWCIPLPGYRRVNTKIVDKKNSWKIWRIFQTGKYHGSYGNESYY